MDLPPAPPPNAPAAPPTGRRRRRTIVLAVAGTVVVVVAVLALAVFEVQTLFTDDEVAEAGPTFASGAVAPPMAEGLPTGPAPEATGAGTPTVTVVGTGTFVAKGHPGEGTTRLLTDGAQTFVRLEDDFATDNGPDLRVRVVVGGDHVEVGALKGNRGAQNYELPAEIDPGTVTAVDVWCRRFDYVFTEATLA